MENFIGRFIMSTNSDESRNTEMFSIFIEKNLNSIFAEVFFNLVYTHDLNILHVLQTFLKMRLWRSFFYGYRSEVASVLAVTKQHQI